MRDIAIRGEGKTATATLGNYVFSAGKSANKAVMDAFRTALEKEYGALGTHAFDTVLGSRDQLRKSLRACDVKAVLSRIPELRENRFIGELNRQLAVNPKMMQLSDDDVKLVKDEIRGNFTNGVDLKSLKTPHDVSAAVAKRIEQAVNKVVKDQSRVGNAGLGNAQVDLGEAGSTEPTGLRNLKSVFEKGSTSVEDKIKRGLVGVGMRINNSETNPVLLEKLKTNGVEPGFIYRNDWSKDDTRGFMADINSSESRNALEALKEKNPMLAKLCEGKKLYEQIMLAGRAHPAAMSAVATFVVQQAAAALRQPEYLKHHPFKDLAKALERQLSPGDLDRLVNNVADPKNAKLLTEVKVDFFVEIRDAILNIGPNDDFYTMSPVFAHFSERHIQKLDYNESDRSKVGAAAHEGKFMRPERILATRKPILGQIYRLQSAASADSISAGAVTEALANDLTRIAGIPSQELTISRGEYSDGHPKLMLEAKFAKGYRDMEAGFIKDGRVVTPPGAYLDKRPEALGKYKAFFLLTADRDGVGKRGQNKGFVGGKFFAIDPGHSLEGNGKYLDISDDFSFKDTYGLSTKPRFSNFSVFDDDTRFAKLSGLVELRETARSGAFDRLFKEYRDAFNPNAEGISDAEKALRVKINAEIDKKEAEFKQQLGRLLKIGDVQLRLYDDLAARGPAVQEKAVNAISHLEMLTSPTTWVSRKGEVALNHLEVRPETRVPWRAEVVGDDIVYHCDRPMDGSTVKFLETLAQNSGVKYEYDNWGNSRLVVPQGAAEKFFAVFSEENVQKLTHPEEYKARMDGSDSLKVARDYKPVTYSHVPNPNPPIKAEDLPEQLDVRVDGVVVKIPKIHYQDMSTTRSSISRPRSVGELRASLEARIRRGNDIIRAIRSGNTELFQPTLANVVALTHAIHVAGLRKGEFMYRGSFSISDPEGNLARWLDKAENLYVRTSTHARAYQYVNVDGHLNMARGLDVPTGMGGLFNGMRTFHYFTIPDADGLRDNGGSGPKRRLFLKCETFGIFCSTAHISNFGKNKEAAKSEGMKSRYYQFGDIIESILHGGSLVTSFFTPKEAPGIRKENLLDSTKKVVETAERKLKDLKEDSLAQILMIGMDSDSNGGVRQLLNNMAAVLDSLPEDENRRAEVTEILDELLEGVLATTGRLSGEISQRMGNEIMVD